MLLIDRLRRHGTRDGESGSALATVLVLLAATTVIATTLVTMTLFSVGHTSADRAGVQARAAAEGGLAWAMSVLDPQDPLIPLEACRDSMFASDGSMIGAPSVGPGFTVTVQHRSSATGWVSSPRCPDPAVATEIRVVSVGRAADNGIRGHRSMDTHTMETVIALPRPLPNAIFSEHGTDEGSKIVTVVTAPEDATAKNDDATTENPFPRITANDTRFAGMEWKSWATGTQAVRTSKVCDIDQAWMLPLTIGAPTVLDSRSDCPAGLKVTKDFTIVLSADLVLLVNSYTHSSGTVTVRSGDGAEHSLSLVHPMSSAATACSPGTVGIMLSSSHGAFSQPDGRTRVLLYSATGVETSASLSLRGQIYGCTVKVGDDVNIGFAAAGGTAPTLAQEPPPTPRLAWTRDVAE